MSIEESKEINIPLDDESIEILKKVPVIHRNSIINVAIRLVAKTDMYKELNTDKDVQVEPSTAADLGNTDADNVKASDGVSNAKVTNKVAVAKAEPAKKVSSWDDF